MFISIILITYQVIYGRQSRLQSRFQYTPAFDVTYAWNPDGAYTGRQQMSVNGKREDFWPEDLLVLAEAVGLKTGARIGTKTGT